MHSTMKSRSLMAWISLAVLVAIAAVVAVIWANDQEPKQGGHVNDALNREGTSNGAAKEQPDSSREVHTPRMSDDSPVDEFGERLEALIRLSDAGRWGDARALAIRLRRVVGSDPETRSAAIRERMSKSMEEAKRTGGQTEESIRVQVRRASYLAATLPRQRVLGLLAEAFAPWKLPLADPRAQRWKQVNGLELSLQAFTALQELDEEVTIGAVAYCIALYWSPELSESSLEIEATIGKLLPTHVCDPVISQLLVHLRPHWRKSGQAAHATREIRNALLSWLEAPRLSERLKSQIRSMLNDELRGAAGILEALRRAKSHAEACGLIRKWLDEDEYLKGNLFALIEGSRHAIGSWSSRAFSDALINSKLVQSKQGVGAVLSALAVQEDIPVEDAALCLMVMQEAALNYQSQQNDLDATFTLASDSESTKSLLRRWMSAVARSVDRKNRNYRIGESGDLGVLILNADLPLADRLALLNEFLAQNEHVNPGQQVKILQRLCWTNVNTLIAHKDQVVETLRATLTARYTPPRTDIASDRAYVAACVLLRGEQLLRALGYPRAHADVSRRLADYAQDASSCKDEYLRPRADEAFAALDEAGYFE